MMYSRFTRDTIWVECLAESFFNFLLNCHDLGLDLSSFSHCSLNYTFSIERSWNPFLQRYLVWFRFELITSAEFELDDLRRSCLNWMLSMKHFKRLFGAPPRVLTSPPRKRRSNFSLYFFSFVCCRWFHETSLNCQFFKINCLLCDSQSIAQMNILL